MLSDRQARMTNDRPITFEDFCAVMRDLEKEDSAWMEPDRYIESTHCDYTKITFEAFKFPSKVYFLSGVISNAIHRVLSLSKKGRESV